MKLYHVVILLLILNVACHAVIMSSQQFTIDFSDPNAVRENVFNWIPPDQVQQTGKGFVFQNPSPATSVDFALTTIPYAIGLSWRPTAAVRLGVELSPVGDQIEYSGGTMQPSYYRVFVRYSPDLKNWSSWCAMQDAYVDWEARKQAGKHQYDIQLQIPQTERTEYTDYLYQYMRMDVPWSSDEEAMVKWILTKDPDFFENHIPFIGYVQFLCESGMRANQPLSRMNISINWGVGGLHSTPKDESVYQNRNNIPWRYKAPDATFSPVNQTIW